MYLKKIELQGFKSFADKISLDFESGITAVVGPNGSGKSNIGDAVRWVLGEQSAKTLRGSKMEDVIFAGTENRKPVSFAEVSLILDNSDSILPVEYSEVSVTRRIFRSGESEYYINKSSCRLKDIHELFMDTGIGRDGYSIIGQGRIDEILSTKSEDRRNVFEEASGIMKYKTRKIEAERKLESTKQNLLRINDIISELEIQIDPLKEQSDKAKRYLELAEQLKILDINLFIENYGKLNEKLQTARVQFDEIEASLEEYNQKLGTADESYNKLGLDNKNLENEILELNQKVFEIDNLIEKINSEIGIANEKIANHSINKDRIAKDILGYKEKISQLEAEIDIRNTKLAGLTSLVDEISSVLQTKEDKVAAINQILEQNAQQIEGLKSDIIEKHNEIANKKGSINSVNVLIENINNRKNQIQNEADQLKVEKQAKEDQLKALQESIENAKAQSVKISDSIEKLSHERDNCERQLKDNAVETDKVKGLVNSKTSRYTLLRDMDKEYEGFSKSVKTVLQTCEKSDSLGRGVHGALVQLISVPKKYETAIEVALGGALQNIITDDEESAKKVIEFLKSNNLGRATFLPITSVKTRGFDGQENGLASQKGFVGVASELLEYNKKYSGIIGNLLGRVLVVDSMDNAIQMARKNNYSFKIVTLEGEVLNPGGSLTGGSTNKSTSLLSRAREIEELSNEIKALNIQLEILQRKNIEESTKLEQIGQDIESEKLSQRQSEILLAASESEVKLCIDQVERLAERMRIMDIESGQLTEQHQNALDQIELTNKQIEQLQSEIDEITKKTADSQGTYKGNLEERDQILESITQEKVKLSGINQEMISITENIDRVQAEIGELRVQVNAYSESIGSIDLELGQQNDFIELKKKELEEQSQNKEQAALHLKETTEKKAQLEKEIDRLQKSWKEYNTAINTVSAEKNRVEVKITKYEMELETLQNRIWDEYEMTYNKCLELQQDISHFGNPNKAIGDIRKEINSLGSINVSAIEEYVKVKERFEFMSVQRADLEDAEKSLRKVINDMVHIMKKQFVEQFDIINKNFNEVFKELFGGGRAHLKLLDEENVLECGIEIEAQPPGKKLQNLSLLSGGERALTAIAILFAMLKVRPTPFCILDEIEAALDDVNVFRFADYIKKFSDNTQFLLVTHRKGTMEAADVLYGVTMQEHGISKLVSVKLSEQAS